MNRKEKLILLTTILVISIIIAGGIGALALNNHFQVERQNLLQAQQLKKQKAAEAQQAALDEQQKTIDSTKSFQLQMCLDSVDSWYNLNSTGAHTQDYWDLLNTNRQQQIDECKLRGQ